MRILVVEDEAALAEDVRTALEQAGFTVELCADGETAWFKGDVEEYAAIILDLGLPTLDGLSVLKRWRQAGRSTPVLILTARGGWSERVEGIDAGADDYLPKPFQTEELIARLHAILRRSAGKASSVLSAGRVVVDARRMRVTVDGKAVALTPLEYRALAYLLYHAGRVVPAVELVDHVYGGDDARGQNTLDVLLGRLRRKVGAGVIVTHRGFGYVVEEEAGLSPGEGVEGRDGA
ncbi:MAG: response regulator transcription factor [Rhodobacteraceae bacterium]|nr:response regulator transcription factor [Paracoccaceae bacterium]